MPSYYFTTYQNERRFYEVRKNKVTIEKPLSNKEVLPILQIINKSSIQNLQETSTGLIITFNDYTELNIDYTTFRSCGNNFDVVFENLRQKVKDYRAQQILKEKFKNYVPSVNRHKSKNMGKMVVTLSLASSLILMPKLGNLIKEHDDAKNINLDDESYTEIAEIPNLNYAQNIEPHISYETPSPTAPEETPQPESTEQPLEEPTPTVTPNAPVDSHISIAYAFEDRTNTSRLSGTIDYAGDIIDYYATRWGLPTNLVLAQLSQERPNADERGVIKNICQLTPKYFVNRTFKMPVYNENGFTGTYDEFTTTEASINSLEGNIMAGIAYLRECVDKTDSFITGLYIYNQGDPSFARACNYYGVDKEQYKGDENALKACEMITNCNKAKFGDYYGDYHYLEHVFSYLPMDEDGTVTLKGYIGEEKVVVAIANTLDYNKATSR